MTLNDCVAGVRQHLAELGVGVSVAFGSSAKHGEAESGGHWWRDAIIVGNELDDRHSAAGIQSAMTLGEKLGVFRGTEVVEDVGEQNEIVVDAEVDGEGVTGDSGEAVGQAELLRVLGRDGKNVLPIESYDVSLWIALRDGETEHSVRGCDVENFDGAL